MKGSFLLGTVTTSVTLICLALQQAVFCKEPQIMSNGEPLKRKIEVAEPTKRMDFEENRVYQAVIRVMSKDKETKGEIVCELFPKQAPLSVTNFIQLARSGFYDSLKFHRVVPNFVIQGGDPEGTGRGGPGYTLPQEIQLPHEKGALAWARLPDAVNRDKRSSGSQFYITLEKTSFLDNEYTVFGQTISGMDVVGKVAEGDEIETIEIIVK